MQLEDFSRFLKSRLKVFATKNPSYVQVKDTFV